MRFGSVCSGIEAASVAWNPLGWEAAWLAEIEPFPSAVLKHHYPDVPNLGDMTALPERIRSGEVEAPDLFCGGTPCQAFSVAGKRQSLSDARGNLSLTFCDIADAIDESRSVRGLGAAIIFWENVPGVLSTSDNAFGCFLAQLCGGSEPLYAPDGWPDAGCVSGPRRTAAWRVLDAQYFGLAQRRRRVFVVASAREGFDPAAVLFEFGGLRRDTAPSREKREGLAGTLTAGTGMCGASDNGDPNKNGALVLASTYSTPAIGEVVEDEIASTITKNTGGGGETQNPAYVAQPIAIQGNVIGRDVGGPQGVGASDDGVMYTLTKTDIHGVAQPIAWDEELNVSIDQAGTLLRGGAGGRHDGVAVNISDGLPRLDDVTGTLDCWSANGRGSSQQQAVLSAAVAFHPTQDPISSTEVCHSIGANENATAAVLAPTLTASNDPSRSPQSSEITAQVAAVVQATAAVMQSVAAFKGGQGSAAGGIGYDEHIAPTLSAADGSNRTPTLLQAMQVRRLTPVECERLQGFPDGYTAISWRGKPVEECPDGPRYKALGNSWAVPVVRWIGARIAVAL